jgi:hypothetical protein
VHLERLDPVECSRDVSEQDDRVVVAFVEGDPGERLAHPRAAHCARAVVLP